MTEKGYNGWTNYETWCVNLWLDNDEGSQSFWAERARNVYADAVSEYTWQTKRDAAVQQLADELSNEVDTMNPVADDASMFSDLMGAALSEVDWRELASHYIDAAIEEEDADAS